MSVDESLMCSFQVIAQCLALNSAIGFIVFPHQLRNVHVDIIALHRAGIEGDANRQET
jgi:hypothetical protein